MQGTQGLASLPMSCAAHRASQHWCGMDWVAPARALARRTRAAAITAALLLGIVEPGASLAAPPVGTVTGIAKDALERPVPGAQMRLESSDGQVVGRSTADDQGRFQFTGIAPGTYAVVGEKEGFETSTSAVTISESAGATADLTLASKQPLDVAVLAKRLEEARMTIQPRIGASTYEITKQAIEAQPGGQNNSLSQVLLQAPGVTQDSTNQGAIHVRNEHANVQYRINGVILPEGVSLFATGGGLSPRFASKVDLITGALPAEYGLRTSGIIDIQTKNGVFDPGGYLGMYGGSFSWLQPSFEYGGSQGRLNYYGTGSYLQNSIGISPATPNGPIHDDTKQGFGFGYLEYVLNPTSKVSAIVGHLRGSLPDPERARRHARVHRQRHLRLRLHESEREPARAELLRASCRTSRPSRTSPFRLSTFLRYSNLRFSPDPLPDLIFNGIAQQYFRSNTAGGLQAEGSYKITDTNTVRAGLIISAEGTGLQTTSSVLPTVDGVQSSDTPFSIFQSTPKIGSTYSVYAQDEWRILPSLTINGGLRFDAYLAYRDEWQISPRLAATWTPTSTTTVHAGYARYFTPPPLIFTPTSHLRAIRRHDGRPGGHEERDHQGRAGPLPRCRRHPADHPRLEGRRRRLLQAGDQPARRRPVRRAHRPDAVQLQAGLQLGRRAHDLPQPRRLHRVRQPGARRAAGQAHRDRAIPLLRRTTSNFIYNHYIHTDHAQFLTASAGVSYQWQAHALQRRHAGGERAQDHRQHAQRLDRAGLSAGQPRHHARASRWGRLGGFEARFDIINVANKNYVIRNGERDRRLRHAVRAAAGLLRRAEEGVLSARADVGKELRSWNMSTASSRSCAWAARRSIRCSSSRSSPRW